jgi:predicted Zn-dependent peptidase
LLLDQLSTEKRRLDNGLWLVAVPLPNVHRAVLHAQLRIGSRFERAQDNGISHFLEHMLYRGTRLHPSAHAQSLHIERRGGALDAATSAENGTLSLVCPPESLLGLVETFAEVFQRPLLDAIDVERGIVREELLESLDEAGNSVDPDDLIRALSFPEHALGQPIAGTLERLETFDRPRLLAHHAGYYTACNSVLVVSGAIDVGRTFDALEKHFRQLPMGVAASATPPPAEQDAPRFQYVRHHSSQSVLRVAFRSPAAMSSDEPGMEVLSRLLDDGMATRLYHRICDELGLCYEVSGGYEVYSDAGLLELSAETSHEQAPAVLDELLGIVRELRDMGPDDAELAAAIERYRWQSEALLDDPYSLAEMTADTLLNGRHELPAERVARIAAVGMQEVRDVARRWLRATQLNVLVVGSVSKPALRRLEQSVMSF